MTSLRRTLVAVALLCPLAAPAQQPGLKLKPQTYLLPPPEQDVAADPILFLEADRASGTAGQRIDASGNVKLRSRGRVLSAENLSYDARTEQVEASGGVRLDRRGDVLETERLSFDLRNERGVAESPEYFFRDLKARGRAEKFWLDSRTRYRAEGATYSTCEVPEKEWYLKLRNLEIDRDKDKGTARGAAVRVRDVPVLYFPWLEFPLSDARKSGLLSPFWGTSGRSGFEFTQPIYLNLAPNYDATVAPRFLAKRGLMLNSEVRYLGRDYNGMFTGQYLDSDRERQGETRYGLSYRHNQAITPRLAFYTNLQKVSDDNYFVDLSNRLAVTSQTNLLREGGLTYSGGWWSARLRTQTFQTLQDPNAPITPPYFRLPQLTYNALGTNVRGFDLSLQTEYVDFSHPTLLTGQRAIAYPSVSYPLQTAFVNVVPKVGLHYTAYDLAGQGVEDATRALPIFSIDNTVTFERTTRIQGSAYTQTLEPRLYYVYIPRVDQNDIPIFDTNQFDPVFDAYFVENIFTGPDRVNDANRLSLGLTTRFIPHATGIELLRLSLGQVFYFEDREVQLPGNPPGTSDFSPTLGEIGVHLDRHWSAAASGQWDVLNDSSNNNLLQQTAYRVAYSGDDGRFVRARYGKSQNVTEYTDLAYTWPVADQVSLIGRWAYSLDLDENMEALAGIEYGSCCWRVRAFARRYLKTVSTKDGQAGEQDTSFLVQLELRGLGAVGDDIEELLDRSLQGFVSDRDHGNAHVFPDQGYR